MVIDNIADVRDFKKLLRTKTNVLVCFTNSLKQSAAAIKNFKEAAQIVRGQGTMVLIDCSGCVAILYTKINRSNAIFCLLQGGEKNVQETESFPRSTCLQTLQRR